MQIPVVLFSNYTSMNKMYILIFCQNSVVVKAVPLCFLSIYNLLFLTDFSDLFLMMDLSWFKYQVNKQSGCKQLVVFLVEKTGTTSFLFQGIWTLDGNLGHLGHNNLQLRIEITEVMSCHVVTSPIFCTFHSSADVCLLVVFNQMAFLLPLCLLVGLMWY